MERLLLVIAFVFVSNLSSQLFAQSSTSITSDKIAAVSNLLDLNNTDWSFYIDEEQHIYYIDFEKISVNLNDIRVMNTQNEVVLEDQLHDLPVNTIYELDLSNLPKGNYEIELRSFTGKVKKQVTVE